MVTQGPVKVGVIGCGNISGEYLSVMSALDVLEISACADLDLERARARATEFDVPKACSVDELLADPEIEIVVNLTVPRVHAAVGMAVLEAGKSLYNEKPLAIDLNDARQLVETAQARGLLLAGAPDTFLGPALQTCRQVIDDGVIGEPIGAAASFLCHGPESWHPDPSFFYQPGGGPMLDMGPYYLTAFIFLIGPIRRVTGSTRITFPHRTITAPNRYGEIIEVTTPTHVTGVLDFMSGAVATIAISFDVWHSTLPPMEIYGTHGTLLVPDPNFFDQPVRVRRADDDDWRDVPQVRGFAANGRGIGVADMAYALRSGLSPRAGGDLAYHVLEIMHAFDTASREGKHVELLSSCHRPAPLPVESPQGVLRG